MYRTICIIFLFPVILFAEDFLLFKPLAAYTFEPRTEAIYQFGPEKIRLDIGAGFDLYDFKSDSVLNAIGTDFFVMTRLRTESNFKFPVETSDYYFGLHYSILFPGDKNISSLRVRLAHVSSHLNDGYTNNGQFKINPIIYSREFLELTYAHSNKKLIQTGQDLRFYGGAKIIFSNLPKNTNSIVPYIGFDYETELTKSLNFISGYHFELSGISNIWSAGHSATAGIAYYFNRKYGVLCALNYFDGKSIHGQFYNEKEKYLGLRLEILYY